MTITIICEFCKQELSARYNTQKDTLEVELCDTCLERKREEGITEGFKEGYAQAEVDNEL